MTAASDSDEALATEWRVIVDAVNRSQARIARTMERAGIPAQWFSVLHLLLHEEDHRMPMARLAGEVSITPGGFSKLADRMGREGLIDRRGATDDRRIVYATLTPDGLIAARRSHEVYLAALREHVLDHLSPAEITSASETFGKLRREADQADERAARRPV